MLVSCLLLSVPMLSVTLASSILHSRSFSFIGQPFVRGCSVDPICYSGLVRIERITQPLVRVLPSPSHATYYDDVSGMQSATRPPSRSVYLVLDSKSRRYRRTITKPIDEFGLPNHAIRRVESAHESTLSRRRVSFRSLSRSQSPLAFWGEMLLLCRGY